MIDVLRLAEEVEFDSRSGKLSEKLLADGNTLFGKNTAYPKYLECITPSGRITLGHFKNGEFEALICLLSRDI